MKKNLRIASAAAAALLAVAPVAASAVSVNAAVADAKSNTLSSEVVLDRATNTQFTAKLSNEQKTELLKSVFSGEKVDISSLNLEATVVAATAPDTTGKFQQTLALTITKKDGTEFGSGHGLTLSADKKSLTGAQATVSARFAAQQCFTSL